MSTPNPFSQPSPPTTCHHHAFAGIGAGTVAVLCMNPLDLLKVKFQVPTRGPEGGIGRGIWRALRDIHASEGWRGLYRGLSPNVAGNASSWGLYSLLYNQLKRCATVDAPDRPVTASQYLLFSSEASGVRAIFHNEGWGRLYRETLFSLTGARQFMAHEKTKVWAFERKRRCIAKLGPTGATDDDRLSNTAYAIIFGMSKPGAVIYYGLVNAYAGRLGAGTHHCTISSTIARTWTHEGLAGFYQGLATNLVRVPLGTCVTFVVYEDIAWLLKHAAARREAHQGGDEGSQ
ncbi:mitochondrial carrier domain-containing protein [Lactarius hatsudake]|nr:mitochondrial carrier domain-containing protein [Lactarius hatsudake]